MGEWKKRAASLYPVLAIMIGSCGKTEVPSPSSIEPSIVALKVINDRIYFEYDTNKDLYCVNSSDLKYNKFLYILGTKPGSYLNKVKNNISDFLASEGGESDITVIRGKGRMELPYYRRSKSDIFYFVRIAKCSSLERTDKPIDTIVAVIRKSQRK